MLDRCERENKISTRFTLAVQLVIRSSFPQEEGASGVEGGWVSVSLAGHALAGAAQRSAEAARLRDSFPEWSTVTGWAADLHLYDL